MPVDVMTERDVQRALAVHCEHWRVFCIPNLNRWHEMDFAVLTKASYLYEYEIKCDQRDWNRDIKKRHRHDSYVDDGRFGAPVKQFCYVYARGLVAPDWVRDDTGLIEAAWHVAKSGERVLRLTLKRRPKYRKVAKVSDRDKEAILRSVHARFWKQMLNGDNEAEAA